MAGYALKRLMAEYKREIRNRHLKLDWHVHFSSQAIYMDDDHDDDGIWSIMGNISVQRNVDLPGHWQAGTANG